MKSLPEHVKAKGFTNWKDYMASLRSKRGKHSRKDAPPKSVFKPYFFDPRVNNPRRYSKARTSYSNKRGYHFTHERLRTPKRFHHMRTVKVGEHRVIVGCPVPVHRGRCPVGTVAQAILHPRKEGYEFERLRPRKNPSKSFVPKVWGFELYDAFPNKELAYAAKKDYLSAFPNHQALVAKGDFGDRGRLKFGLYINVKASRFGKNPIAVYNPSQKLPLGQVSIRYRRSAGKYKGDLYEHKFGNSVDVYGIEGGSLMIVPKRRGAKLWGTTK